MNNKIFILVFFCLVVIVFSCGKDNPMTKTQSQQASVADKQSGLKNAKGAAQVSGIGFFDATDACGTVALGAAML
jgi:hypothetical protein